MRSRHESLRASASANIAYLAVDFTTGSLAEKLRQTGYRAELRTVFLWEGVTPYLDWQAVDEVARLVASAGAGSSIIFDYILSSVVEGTCLLHGAQNEFSKMSRTSEPLTFGFLEGEASSFLAGRGFGDVVDVGAPELTSRYFDALGTKRYIKPWWRIVSGEVA